MARRPFNPYALHKIWRICPPITRVALVLLLPLALLVMVVNAVWMARLSILGELKEMLDAVISPWEEK